MKYMTIIVFFYALFMLLAQSTAISATQSIKQMRDAEWAEFERLRK